MSTQPAALGLTIPSEPLDRRISVAQVQSRRSAIVELMKSTMQVDVDFGTIPGTPKPTLYKPGAEKVCSLFQLAPRVHVTDLSTPDSIRYQVRVEMYTASGAFCGEGIGAASSAETKYQWRAAVCDEEFDITPEDRRRIAYKKKRDGGFYTVAQVRTEPEDADNTILKMAKKRALIDAVLTVTAASDIFAQDVEDLPDPAMAEDGGGGNQQTQSRRPPQRSTGSTASAQRPPVQQQQNRQPNRGRTITVPQQQRFHSIASNAGKTADQVKQYLWATFKTEHSRDLLMKDEYDQACAWAGAPLQQTQQQQRPDAPDPSDYDGEEQLEPGEYDGRQF
jgi:hypothetical protein